MSNKSGVSSQVISLPKGGGALQSLGEKFSPDLHTGTGNFSVPITLPPGRNGFQPQLTLSYSTGGGNGPFGLGWSLSVPGVTRKTSKGIPRYNDVDDVFLLSGAEDLVAVSGATDNDATRYRPRTEGLFARIDRHRVAGSVDPAEDHDYWKVRSKDGLISIYGTPRPDDAQPDWLDPAVVVDPENPRRIFAWKLTRTIDPFGNRIEYRYIRDGERTDGPHHWDQVYLSRVQYVDYDDPEVEGQTRFLVTVDFEYEARPDPFSEYRSGFEVRTVKRCTAIRVSTDTGTTRQVRGYSLVYLDQLEQPEKVLPPSLVSLLCQVRVTGHDGELTESMPPLEFSYTAFEPLKRRLRPLSASHGQLPNHSLAHGEYELVDLSGTGFPISSSSASLSAIGRTWATVASTCPARWTGPLPASAWPTAVSSSRT